MAGFPRWIEVFRLRLRSLLRRGIVDRELDDELQFHLERTTDANIAQGMSPTAAQRLAMLSLHGIERRKEECREARGVTVVSRLVQDFRLAIRMLRHRPMFSLAAIGTLALAIGANIAIFGLIDRVLLHPLDVPEAAQLFTVQRIVQRAGASIETTSMNWEQASRAIGLSTRAAAVSSSRSDRATRRLEVVIPGRESVDAVDAQFVSANYFRVLGLHPNIGRDFTPSDNTTGAPPVVLLGYRYWRSRFGGRLDALGQTIHINGTSAVVVGVTPRTFAGVDLTMVPPDLVLPLMTASRLATNINGGQTDGKGGFYFGSKPEDALSPVSPIAEFTVLARSIGSDANDGQTELAARIGSGWTPVSLIETMVPFGSHSELRRFLGLLASAVGLTLLIGCANLAGLLLARSEERRSEFAVRVALGASRGQLVQALVVEAAVLAAAGGASALLVARWIDQGLSVFVLPGGIVLSSLRPGMDVRTLAVALVSTTAAAVIIGIAPVWWIAKRRVPLDLKTRRPGLDRLGAMRLLAGVQVTVCVVLVFGAALFVRSTAAALSTDLGFDGRDLVSATISVPRAKLQTGPQDIERLVGRIRALPDVAAASIGPLPLVRASDMTLRALLVDGAPVDLPEPVDVVYAASDYFTTLGLPLVAGRDFGPSDQGDSQPVAIVNEAAARQFWSGAGALGHQIARAMGRPPRAMSVIGVARDARLRNLRDATRPVIYLPRSQNETYLAGYLAGSGSGVLIVRARGNSAALGLSIVRLARNAGLSAQEVTTLQQRIREILMPQRLGRVLLILLGAMALSLTVVGIYGLLSCVVTRQTKEIGIRLALGAAGREVASSILRRIFVPVSGGLVVGAGLAWMGGRLANRFMYGITGTDVTTLAVVLVAIAGSSVLAAFVPMRRALKTNPIETLRVD